MDGVLRSRIEIHILLDISAACTTFMASFPSFYPIDEPTCYSHIGITNFEDEWKVHVGEHSLYDSVSL